MKHHRIPSIRELYRVPQPPQPAISANGFVVCPLPLLQTLSPQQLLWQDALYQLAFEQTRAQLRPSLPERDLLAVWN
jgi:hypothetical protein